MPGISSNVISELRLEGLLPTQWLILNAFRSWMVPNYCVQNLSVSSEKHYMTWKKNDLKILWNGSECARASNQKYNNLSVSYGRKLSSLFCKVRLFTVPEGDESYIILWQRIVQKHLQPCKGKVNIHTTYRNTLALFATTSSAWTLFISVLQMVYSEKPCSTSCWSIPKGYLLIFQASRKI